MLKKFALPTLFAGAFALAAISAAPQQAQAASKTENFILGLAAGVATTAIVASALSRHKKRRHYRRHYRSRTYYRPYYEERVYYRPRRVQRYRYRPRPWTPEWYDYCMSKYRSFDPETGYFRTYSGRLKFCR